MANDVIIQEGVDENLRPLKVKDKLTAIETAQHGDGVRVNGDLEVTGMIDTVRTNFIHQLSDSVHPGMNRDLIVDADIGDIIFRCGGQHLRMYTGEINTIIINDGSPGTTSIQLNYILDTVDYFKIGTAANGATTITTVDDAGTAANLTFNIDGKVDINSSASDDIELDAGGDIILDADGGNISLLDGGSAYTPTAASDAVPLNHMPFVLYSQFQDDLGTAKHYLPLKGYFEQSFVGHEPAGMIAPFNMKLQKIIMRSSEDISGTAWRVGMWALDSGAAHAHHHTTGFNWIQETGGAIDTNATFDFTGTVGLAASGSGGSNAVTAGQWIDFAIQADTDVTSANAEFWITMFFIADLSNTI